VALLAALLLVFGWNSRANAHLFYLLFLPVLWIAVRRGMRGAIVGILSVDASVALVTYFVPRHLEDLALLQFLMLILALTGLIVGTSIEERSWAQGCPEEEQPRVELILESAAEGVYESTRAATALSSMPRTALKRAWTDF
jgi:integral membrane sensor domain MASE1